MRLLRILTLGHVAVLVPTLASSLVAIWIYLRRIADRLAEVGQALAKVEAETRPLEEHFQQLNDAVIGITNEVKVAEASLTQANDRLETIAEQRGAIRHAE